VAPPNEQFVQLLKYSWPLYLTTILIGFSAHVDKLILGRYVSRHDLGIYYSAFTLSSFISLIMLGVLFLYLPVASRYFNSNKYRLMSIINSNISKWFMVGGFIPFWLLYEYSEEVIVLVFGYRFSEGASTLKILALAQYVNVSLGFTGQNLLAVGDSLNQMKTRMFGFLISVAAGIYLSSVAGIVGVAYSILIALLVTNFIQIGVLIKKHSFIPYSRFYFYSGLVVCSAPYLLRNIHRYWQIGNWMLVFIVDCAIFFGLVFVFRLIGKRDLRVIRYLN